MWFNCEDMFMLYLASWLATCLLHNVLPIVKLLWSSLSNVANFFFILFFFSVRQVDEKYFNLPAQVKSVALGNITPAALVTDMETLDSNIG